MAFLNEHVPCYFVQVTLTEMNNKRCIKKTDCFTHFYFSHLQKNGKVSEMITATHNFSGSFVDQCTSLV